MRESGENYLETIYVLQKRKGDVRSIDVAQELNYSKPSVSRAMGILRKLGYITISSSGVITFTEDGYKLAEAVSFRHQAIKTFLKNTLHINDEVADIDACRIEHVISEQTFNAIAKLLDKD